jgi:HlyD family secretion protein
MRFWIKTTVMLLLLVAIVGAASYFTYRFAKKKYAPGATLHVRVETVTAGTLAETISASAVVQPKRRVKISAKVSSRIEAIPVKEGDKVTAGDPDASPPVPATVLVRLDDRGLRSRLRAARANRDAMLAQLEVEKATIESRKADLVAMQATLKQLKRDFERKKVLRKSRDIAQTLFDEAQSRWEEKNAGLDAARFRLKAATHNLDVLKHRIESADADIDQAEEALAYTVIRAPIDGTVTTINAEVGEMVVTGTMNNPGTVILEVADLDSMILLTEVDEADVGKVAVGQPATIHVQAYPDAEIKGVVNAVALTHRFSKRGAKYYRTEIKLTACPVTLYSGLTANVDIRTQLHKNVLTVPSQAVLGRKIDDLPMDICAASPFFDAEKTYATVVYRLQAGKSLVTPVKIGPSDMTRTVILGGVKAGDNVVVGPYKVLNKLKHDQALSVTPVNKTTAAADRRATAK